MRVDVRYGGSAKANPRNSFCYRSFGVNRSVCNPDDLAIWMSLKSIHGVAIENKDGRCHALGYENPKIPYFNPIGELLCRSIHCAGS